MEKGLTLCGPLEGIDDVVDRAALSNAARDIRIEALGDHARG